MKRWMGAVLTMFLTAGAGQADPIYGLWQTPPDDGYYAHIRMQPCQDKICGLIAQNFALSGETDPTYIGKTIVFDMNPDGRNSYAGSVWRPSNNKVYIGKIKLSGNKLTMRGCVLGGLLCAKQTWTRVQ